jgi:serine/threonine-protein kinase
VTDDQRLLGDRYQLGDVLGRGGMAEVHVGRDQRLDRRVAIKMLRIDLARDPSAQVRFRREAQSAASLNHPSIVAVYDTGEDRVEGFAGGQPIPYIVMEYVEGSTLRELLASGRRLLPDRALEISAGVLQALDYSHRHGIIHRDIKPANVMLTSSGDVKVMDFGIARALADVSATMTQTSSVIGTAQYLSPEQARGEQVDARSDLYSAGCLLFELLTGRPPFVGDSSVAVAYQHVREEPPTPSALDPEVPTAVDAIVLKSLVKDRGQRYQTAAEMRDDIERHLSGRAVIAPPVDAMATQRVTMGAMGGSRDPAGGATAESGATTTMPRHRDGEARREGHGGRVAAYVLLGLACIAVFVLAALAVGALVSQEPTARTQAPDLQGLSLAEATDTLQDEGLDLGDVDRQNDEREVDTVVGQDPVEGTPLAPGDDVDVVVSLGPAESTVPTVIGLDLTSAQEALAEAGLSLGDVERVPAADPANQVRAADPAEGTTVAEGTSVELEVASGDNIVPGVEGLPATEARTILEQAGFAVVIEDEVTDAAPAGSVLRQAPAAETTARLGTTVTLTAATAAEPPPEPEPEPTTSAPTPEPDPTTSAPTPTPTSTPTPTTSAPPTPTVSPSPSRSPTGSPSPTGTPTSTG